MKLRRSVVFDLALVTGFVFSAAKSQARDAGPDWTAITGIVVSGVVGPALAAVYATRRSAAEHRRARELSDLADVRALLDAAEPALRLVMRRGSAMLGVFITHGRWTAERAKPHIDAFREAVRETDAHAGHLAFRLGRDHPVARAYHRAFDNAVKIDTAVELVGRVPDEYANMQDAFSTIESGIADLTAAHDDFLAEAHAVAASRLARD